MNEPIPIPTSDEVLRAEASRLILDSPFAFYLAIVPESSPTRETCGMVTGVVGANTGHPVDVEVEVALISAMIRAGTRLLRILTEPHSSHREYPTDNDPED